MRNMSGTLTRSLKDTLSIKIKARHDGYTDQFTRLFMTKMFIIASVTMSFDYFNDEVHCILPKSSGLSDEFVHSACWIAGFFIYAEMEERQGEAAYYGIPFQIEFNGINELNKLCSTHDKNRQRVPGCEPMTKLYYLHYQWLPFYVASLAILFYLPYILFRIVNTDLVSLKAAMKNGTHKPEQIVKNYFNYNINPKVRLRLRTTLNIGIKLVYICVNLTAFYFTDYLLHGNYINFGIEYMNWSKENITVAHDLKKRDYPKPANKLLPTMGFCDIQEAYLDVKMAFHNENKFICEISPHILYQYVLMVLWFMLIVSIAISCIGCILHLAGLLTTLFCFSAKSVAKRQIMRVLTLRENEYLLYIRRKNLIIYGDILRKLKSQRTDMSGIPDDFEAAREKNLNAFI